MCPNMEERKSATIHEIFVGGVSPIKKSRNNPWNLVSFSSAPKMLFSIHVAVGTCTYNNI